jgi:CBS domain containing-hemolysin-like protein
MRVARPLSVLMRVTGPVHRAAQRLVDGIIGLLTPKTVKAHTVWSDEEYAELVDLAHQQGTLAEMEKEILLQLLSLDRRAARDVMRPRGEMVMVADDATLEAIKQKRLAELSQQYGVRALRPGRAARARRLRLLRRVARRPQARPRHGHL